MRKMPIAAAAALTILSGSAFAQSSPSPATPTTSPRAAAPTSPVAKAPVQNPLKQEDVSKIIGTSVYGSDGKAIGDVSTVLIKPDDKTIDQLVVSSGGILGIGSHLVAMPLDGFSWDAENGGFKIAKTADDVKSMAVWHPPSSPTSATGSGQPARSGAPAGSGR
jgi:sporulation protein YlmC with PRC-barrel domain